MTCPEQPQQPRNRPGLPALSYRIGDYASFRDRLLSRLTCPIVTPDKPQGISLRQLNTRTNDDPAIALLDACAVVADVLTFYQERIINEGYLLTATERRSVLELARMIGYELNPGVAASTVLAFTVEDAPGSPTVATIAKGTQILSIPEQDELPQTFETSEDFTAHLEWNALKPRPNRSQKITKSTRKLYLNGTSTGLQPGDALLLMDGDASEKPHYLLSLDTVTPNAKDGYTVVTWERQLPPTLEQPPRNPAVIAFRQRANLFGFNAPRWDTMPDEIKLANGGKIKGGVYRYNVGSNSQWQSVNTGLLSFDIRCLVANFKTGFLFAGTPLGIFRSKTNGEIWTLNNTGLTNFSIQTILAASNGELLVGSTGGGVFRSTDDGESWSPIGIGSVKVKISGAGGTQISEPEITGIPNTVVHALATDDFTLTPPTLSTNGTTVTITRGDGIIPLNLQPGDAIVVGQQIRFVTEVSATNPAQVTINDSFRNPPPPLPNGTEINLPLGTVFIAFRPSSSPGASALVLTSSSGNYIFAATDVGVYRSNDQGHNWDGKNNLSNQVVRSLAVCSGFIFAKTDRGILQSSDQGAIWNPTNLTDTSKVIRSLVAFGNDAFVAASDGVYRSRSGGNWEQKNNGLIDTNVWAIAINQVSEQPGDLFAFTASGIFQSTDQGENWTSFSSASKNPDLTAVTACVKSVVANPNQIFVGSAFTGFEKVTEAGWTNYNIPTPQPGQDLQIDLDTLYPRIITASWVVLRQGNRFQLCKVTDVVETQRKDFTLDTKITRILTDTVISQPEKYNLRDTKVLAQSETLSLTKDPLTVAVQQENIFFDPIWTNKVLLSEYVKGLQPQHPVIISGKRIRAEVLNVGGVVQSGNNGDRWLRNNTGLTNTEVTAFTSHLQPELGTLTRNFTAIRGTLTAFTRELKVGASITINGETQTINSIYSDNSLLLNTKFTNELSEVPFTYSGAGTGTIASSETMITGSNTVFTRELKVGAEIKVGEQSIKIKDIFSDTSLLLESAFSLDLPPGTTFTYGGEGTGTISSDRTAITGTNTEFLKTLKVGQAITINNQTRVVTRVISETSLFVDADVDAIASQSFESNTLFVGTNGGGVFRSLNNGNTWEPINRGLTDLKIQAIATQTIQPEASDAPTPGYKLFVGTAKGVFQTDKEIQWQEVNTNLAYSDVRALIAIDSGDLLAGTTNGGVLRYANDGQTWMQTGLDVVDVQTLAVDPNGDIFAGTIADGVFRSADDGNTWKKLDAGLTNPNVTSLVAYRKSGTGKVTSIDAKVLGLVSEQDEPGTAFTTEFAVGDTITIAGQTRRVTKVISDIRLDIDRKFDREDITEASSFQVTRVLAGTAGSGVFRLKPNQQQNPIWEPVANNPNDLNILCLTIQLITSDLFAGTASGGVFRSRDDGNLWKPSNGGLTSLDPQINPTGKVNTEFRAIAVLNQHLFAVGIGILISPDYLYTVQIRSGDRLQVMSPPIPLPEKGREQQAENLGQKWLLKDRDGFTGVVMTAEMEDIRLLAATAEDEAVSEINAIAIPPNDQQEPLLTFTEPIQNSYDPQTVQIYANVVRATHGETIQEVLGNGDGTVTNQKFILNKPPLTYISASTPSGSQTTLQIRVNGVLWQEVPSLYQRSPLEQIYITRIANDQTVTITSGDGINGARLPTGLENITATYRSGIGLAGRVGANQLTLLKTRPLGISEVTNPLPATGAADPETMLEAQTSAPLTIRTLGRIVSLQDYEDFARAFAGIGKAQAKLLWAGETQQVHITVAAIGGAAVLPDSALYINLVKAIDDARDPVQQVQVDSYEPLAFNLEAKLLIDQRYLPDKVLAQVKAALLKRFTFEKRDFGQDVTTAEAIATLQAVTGVVAVDLDALHRRDLTRNLESVPALPARWDVVNRQILPAQLLTISPAGIRLRVEASL
ncbi:putative baseplate assembly protein [Nostoc sp. B(2019)]|nr:putative baseplate assembly protein [Nostoc sp. B(2019)]